jgi:hypothetical protein
MWLGGGGKDLRPLVKRLIDSGQVKPFVLAAPSQTKNAGLAATVWQGFDLNSNAAPGQFRSICIYPGDEAAINQQQHDLRSAIAHALQVSGDGIYDSRIEGQTAMRLGMARRLDPHGDNFILLRPTLVGDLNLDGNVTIADFIDLAAHFGQLDKTWQEGDINYDGNVSIADFIELAAHFGSSYSGGAVAISAEDQQQLAAFVASVPEPISLVFAGMVALFMGLTRRSPSRNA